MEGSLERSLRFLSQKDTSKKIVVKLLHSRAEDNVFLQGKPRWTKKPRYGILGKIVMVLK